MKSVSKTICKFSVLLSKENQSLKLRKKVTKLLINDIIFDGVPSPSSRNKHIKIIPKIGENITAESIGIPKISIGIGW